MNHEGLNRLAGAPNAKELQRTLEALCLPFGKIENIRIVDEKEIKEYLCFIELESPKHQFDVMNKLGGMILGKSVFLRIPH